MVGLLFGVLAAQAENASDGAPPPEFPWGAPVPPRPAPLTPEELVEAREQSAQRRARAQEELLRAWPERQAELAKTLRPTFAPGRDVQDPDFLRHDNAAWRARMEARRDQARADRARVAAELDAVARKYGVDRATSKGTLVGDSPHGPIFMSPQDAIAADSIFADDLWPTGLYAWQNTSLSRNLTGQGTRVSIWEANETGGLAGILTNHNEFDGARVTQVDAASPGNHATAVANVIVGGGIQDVFRDSTNHGKLLRGIAYEGVLYGHNLVDFADETADAVLDGHPSPTIPTGSTAGGVWRCLAGIPGGTGP